jgi:SAM-dependent methyltransferase
MIADAVRWILHTAPGQLCVELLVKLTQFRVFSPRTVHAMRFDLLRLSARRRFRPHLPAADRLHFGCGDRRVSGWLNVDVGNSDADVDFAAGRLPWPDGVFQVVVSQHVIEHLSLFDELLPILGELRRVLRPNGEIWLSCPDMEKVCRGYVQDRARTLLEHKLARTDANIGMGDAPPQHFVNLLFDQDGEHRNLFDFELLAWALAKAGFDACDRVAERDLLERFPGFPPRGDDDHTLYVRARVPSPPAATRRDHRDGSFGHAE